MAKTENGQPPQPVTKFEVIKKYLDKLGMSAKPKAILKAMAADGVKIEIGTQYISVIKGTIKRRAKAKQQQNLPRPATLTPKKTFPLESLHLCSQFVLSAGGLDNAKAILAALEAIR